MGFDLDMTLIDTVPGFARTLEALGAELGVDFPIDDLTSQLGPPLEMMLEPYLAPEAIGPAGDRFRALYPDTAIAPVPVLPGAHEALAAVRRHRGRTVVVTGKYPDNARRHQEHLGLDVDVLEGWVWGVGKAEVLIREGCSMYVGDHVHDVEGALAAGVLSVSVLTGGCTREELLEAGTHVVLESLEDFPAWLDEHLLGVRLAALEADLRARGSVLVAYSGGADSAFLLAAAVRALGAENVVAATGYSRLAAAGRARPGPGVRRVARRRGRHAGDPRDGARGLPRERRRPLLLLQGRAGRGAVVDRRRRGAWSRSRPGRTPTTRSPASGRASRPPTSGERSPRCATPG